MSKPQEHTTPNGYSWYRLDNDANGNPRIMTHFLNLISPKQQSKAKDMHPTDMIAAINTMEQWAKRKVHGKTYRAEWFGGGIVWSTYISDKQIDELIDGINADE